MANKELFLLFASCIPVKGYSKSIIYDLQFGRYSIIPNFLFDILSINKRKSVRTLKSTKKNVFNKENDSYFNMLVDEGFGFYTDEPTSFPDIDLTWKSPLFITNAIVEVSAQTSKNIKKTFAFIDKLGCVAMQIICSKTNIHSVWLNDMLNNLANTRIKSIELFLNNNDAHNIKNLLEIVEKHRRIHSLIIFNSKKDKNIDLMKDKGIEVMYTKQGLDIENLPFISFHCFEINLKLFAESQNHNNYFNRKLFINANGEIKNAPGCKTFGNINNVHDEASLKEIITAKEFQKYWYVDKGHIDVCMDCEYRFMCVDCRLPKQRESHSWYFDTECQYNPYIAKWKEEEGYIPVKQCGTYTKEKGFVVDEKKIKDLNR